MSVSQMPLISIPHNLKTKILSRPFPSHTPWRQTRPLFCCRRCTTRKRSTQTVKRIWFWTTTPPRVQWIPLTWKSTGQVLHVRKVNQTMTNETFLLPCGCCLTECFRRLVYDPSTVETQKVAHTTFIPVCRCLHDEANDWLPVAVSQDVTYADHLQGHAGDRCRTSRIDVCGNRQQETWSMTELPTISGIELTEGWASLHRVSAVCVWPAPKKPLCTTMWSVRCGSNLTLAVMSKQETPDRACFFVL